VLLLSVKRQIPSRYTGETHREYLSLLDVGDEEEAMLAEQIQTALNLEKGPKVASKPTTRRTPEQELTRRIDQV